MITTSIILAGIALILLLLLGFGCRVSERNRQTDRIYEKELTKRQIRDRAEYLKMIGFINSISDFETGVEYWRQNSR